MNQGGSTSTYCTVTFNIEDAQENAQWISISFVNPSDASRQVEAGQPVGTLPELDWSSNNVIFLGWYTTPTTGGQQVSD
jgi:hypothetical protein